MEREREVTVLSLKGGISWGTATGLEACGVDWNEDKIFPLKC